MKKVKRRYVTIFVLILCLLLMAGVIYAFSYEINRNMRVEMENTLGDVAQQNNIAVSKEIYARFQLLISASKELNKNLDNIEGYLDRLAGLADNYDFRRIGYVTSEGILYSTDGYAEDMSEYEFFRLGMAGEPTLTEGMDEWVDKEQRHVSRLAIPVYDESGAEVIGVFYAATGAEWMEEQLDAQAFEGRGYSCIIKVNGDIIAHSEASPIYEEHNFYECLSQSMVGKKSAEQMKLSLQKGESGIGSFIRAGEQSFYYTPLYVSNAEETRYMITIVPTEVLNTRMRPIMKNVEWLLLAMALLVIGGVTAFLFSQQSSRRELERLAYTDSLTLGDNFACFQEKMKEKQGVHGYLISMDISGFKIINNVCGVETGDAVLCHVWEILNSTIGEGEYAARIYADRFVVFLAEEDREKIKARLERVICDVKNISEVLNTPRVVPVFGIYETTNREPLENDYGKAVQAKNLVKGRRDQSYAFYEEVDFNKELEKREIEDGFERAIEEKQFEVWYQPKYRATDGRLVGAEALIRWRKPDGSLLPPSGFIPIFEKNGMIPRLDEYVFRTVCEQQKRWEKEGKRMLPVSVNISRVSLYYYNIVEKYKAMAEELAVDTKYLQLEITESATIGNSEIANLIEDFHAVGFRMLLDDFGSGYSSLSSLNMMQFDTMKLDKSLIDYIGDENGEKLLHYITRLGQNLGLTITAEGVETKAQVEFLRNLKCDDFQGYYFSKPLSSEEYEKLLV